MEEYLRNNFPGGVRDYREIVVDGQVRGYYVKGNNLDELYLPASTSGNVGMLSYIPGAGGSSADARVIRDRINENPPDYPITIAASCSDHQNCMEVGYKLATGANMNVTDNVTVCFSASGYLGIRRTEEFEDRHPEITSTVISCEPYNTSAYSYRDDNNVDGFINSDSQIIFVAPKKGFHINLQNEIQNMTHRGLNAYFLGTSYKNPPRGVHVLTNADILECGVVDYLLGYSDYFDTNPGNGKYTPNYELIHFNGDLNDYEIAEYEDLASTFKAIRIPDIERIKKSDSFEIKAVASPVHEKYQGLSNVEPVTLSSPTMKTCYSYANTQMNNIRKMVKQTSFVNSFNNLSFRSGSGIPGCIGEYLNAYYDIVGSLMNSISLETDSVLSYVQAVMDYDADLAANMNPGQIILNSELEGYIPIGLPEKKEKKHSGTGGGSGYRPTTETPTERKPDYVYDFDGYQGLIYMNGNQVESIKYRYEYSSENDAKKHLSEVKEKYSSLDYIQEVVQTGVYVDAVFKEEAYKDKSYDEIVKEYFEGGKLHG